MKRFAWFLAASVVMSGAALGADVAAGKAKYEQLCAACHEKTDSAGKSAALFEGRIKEIVDGRVNHKKKFKLTDADIKNLAAFWTSP